MQTHMSTTPFGRRPVTLGLLATQMTARDMPREAKAHKWQTFRDICEAREAIGVTDRGLTILDALLSFHPETELVNDGDLVVWPSNEQLIIRAHGVSPATLRRHLSNLVACGLIIRRDSPNGKRFARRGGGGAIEQAFGFDLAPIVARAEEFKELADAVKAEKYSCKLVKERLTICRRDIVKLIESGREEEVPGNWRAFQGRYEAIIIGLPRTAPRQAAEAVLAELEALLEDIRMVLESFIKTQNMSANESHFERHIQNSNPESLHEIEKGIRKEDEASGNVEKTDNVRHLPDREIPLGIVLDACPDIALLHGAGADLRSWRDLFDVAVCCRPMLGISPSAWHEAVEVLGEQKAAITLAAIYQKSAAINNAGGYLRSLTERARNGKFSVWPMIMALLRAKLDAAKVVSADEKADQTPAAVGEEPPRMQASEQLQRLIKKKGW